MKANFLTEQLELGGIFVADGEPERAIRAEGPMDGLAVADAKSVVAPINFTMPMAEKPYSYNYEPPPGVPPRNTKEETHTVTVHDGRAWGPIWAFLVFFSGLMPPLFVVTGTAMWWLKGRARQRVRAQQTGGAVGVPAE